MNGLSTLRLSLVPLTVDHAPPMFELLMDPRVHDHLDAKAPATIEALRAQYRAWERRASPDGREKWLNWVVRTADGIIGFVQATVFEDRTASIAYVLGPQHWGQGYAREAVEAMLDHLGSEYEVESFRATVEAANVRSIRLLESAGFIERPGDRLSPSERLYVREPK